MKNIELDPLKKLLEIIPDYPALRIAHFADSGEEMTEVLSDFCIARSYEYQINCIDPDFYEYLHKRYKDTEWIHPVKFSLQRPRYMMQGKLYDFLFVTIPVSLEERSDFLKKTHGIIKNAGNILIFLPKGSYEERYSWVDLLEEHYYVASNTIEDLFENYDVLISKKMHGWGG